MVKTPIDMMLDGVTWRAVTPREGITDNNLPHVTHEGIFEMMGHRFKVYQLSDGRRIFDAEDFERFFSQVSDPIQRDWTGTDEDEAWSDL